MEVVKVNGSCVTLKDGRKWNMSRIVRCTTTNVPNQVEYQGVNDSDCGNFHHMDISYSNNQQAVHIETEPDNPVDNGQIHNVVENVTCALSCEITCVHYYSKENYCNEIRNTT